MPDTGKVRPLASPEITTLRRSLFVRDLVVSCRIGVNPHEQHGRQRVRVNVEVDLAHPNRTVTDKIESVLSYDDIVSGIRSITGHGHINLVETLADRIAEMCLADHRAQRVKVRVEKLDILADATSAGVEVERKISA